MADLKISQLPSATTPLTGTEVLPVVQGGTTDKVTVENLTAGRAVNAATVTTTGVITSNGGGASFGALILPTNAAYGGSIQFGTNQTSNTAARNWAIVNSYNAYGDLVFRISNALGGNAVGAGSDVLEFDTSKNIKITAGNLKLGTAGKGIDFSGNGGVLWICGAGTPEGAVAAPVGSLFTRTDGGANTTLYVKESGAGNTGWVAK